MVFVLLLLNLHLINCMGTHCVYLNNLQPYFLILLIFSKTSTFLFFYAILWFIFLCNLDFF